jgi:hypothetical protein
MPFNSNRSGMILGSGGIGMVLESEEGARRRFQLDKTSQMLPMSLPFKYYYRL